MKTVILALLVLVVVSQGEALKCYSKDVFAAETCHGSNQVCAHLFFANGHHINSIVGCEDADYCRLMSSQASSAVCCDQDLCTR